MRCTRNKIIAIVITFCILAGILTLALSIGIAEDQSKTPFQVGLGFGLAFLLLAVIVALIGGLCCCCDICNDDDLYSTSDPRRFGVVRRDDGSRIGELTNFHNGPSMEEIVHTALAKFLQEESELQNETDLPKICDRLRDKWHLPHETYNMFDVAFLARTLHNDQQFASVSEAARQMLHYSMDFKSWLSITTDFRTDLMNIRSNHEPEDYSPLANIYVLLKTKSKNINNTDYSPKSQIRTCDIPIVPEAKHTRGRNNLLATTEPSAPPTSYIDCGARPSAPPRNLDYTADISPPPYDEAMKSTNVVSYI